MVVKNGFLFKIIQEKRKREEERRMARRESDSGQWRQARGCAKDKGERRDVSPPVAAAMTVWLFKV
jgi:hypothetical protein